MSKVRNIVTGALVGLSLSGTPAATKAQEAETSKALTETLGTQGEPQEKMADFQQIRKAGEKQGGNELEILRTNKGLRDYLDSHDGVPPYLKDSTIITGKQLTDSLFTADFDPMNDRTYSFIRSGESIILDLENLPSNISINISEGEWTKKQGTEGKYLISKPILLIIKNNDTGMFGFRAVDVGSKLKVNKVDGEQVLGNDKSLVVVGAGTGTYIREDEVLIQKDMELGAVEVEGGVQWLNYIGEDGLYHQLVLSDDPDEPMGNVPIPTILECLKKDGAKLRVEEHNGVRDSIYEIGLECGSKNAYFPENINTPSWRLVVRETIQNCTASIEQGEGVAEAYLIDEQGNKIENLSEIKKDKKVRFVAQAEEGYEINKMSWNGEELECEKQGDGRVISNEVEIEQLENSFKVEVQPALGIEGMEIRSPRISSENGMITVDAQGSSVESVQIYNLGGQLLHQRRNLQGSESFALNPGVYVVKCGSEVVKVAVK